VNIRKIISFFLQTVFVGFILIGIPIFLISLNNYLNLPAYHNVYYKSVGTIFIAIGLGAVIYSAILHLKTGRTTPLPVIEQPKRFIVNGLYKYCRNPMYLSEIFIFLGLFFLFGHLLLLLYPLLFFLIIHVFVVYAEEPELRKRFGEQYVKYTKKVPRWIPKI